MRMFKTAWKRMEMFGYCDAWGGCECRRVYREWLKAGKPRLVATFIRHRANIGPLETETGW
jgi:hypothetical protein